MFFRLVFVDAVYFNRCWLGLFPFSKRKFSEQWIRNRWLHETFLSCFLFHLNERWGEKKTLKIRRPVWQFVSSFVYYWLNVTQNFWAIFLVVSFFSCFFFISLFIHFALSPGDGNNNTQKKRLPKRWAKRKKKVVCDLEKFMGVRVLQSVVRCFFFSSSVVSHFQRISNSSPSTNIHFISFVHLFPPVQSIALPISLSFAFSSCCFV